MLNKTLKRGTTIYKVIEWNDNSNLCLLEQTNKKDKRQKVFNKDSIIDAIKTGKIKVLD